ncbi:MAG: DNA (cytosine-5-)-methyltransferase [Thermoguttaceae bacterium]|nr:DNA (cytosine-5-)-methyltransferase [Thermoguttaceae bacterium]
MSNRVRQMREARRVDLKDFAAQVNVSPRLLIALEEDACDASVFVALRIARALGSTVEEIFGDEQASETSVCESEPQVAPEPEQSVKPRSEKKKRKAAPKRKSEPETTGAGEEKVELPEIAPYATDLAEQSFDELMATQDVDAPRSLFEPIESESPRRVYAPRHSQTTSSNFSKTAKKEGLADSPANLADPTLGRPVRYFDLFCGIGGFRYAAQNAFAQMNRASECVLSCDVDEPAQRSYAANFGETPFGDVARLASGDIPDFDLLMAGFPCQTFSIIGLRKGFADETKGSLFFQIARILKDKRPRAFVLENVRQLTTHDSGRTFQIILRVLQEELGYCVDWRVLNALDCGLPQKRERVVVVGSTEPFEMEWPKRVEPTPLSELLENDADVDKKYFASPEIVRKRKEAHRSEFCPSIWHENKSGNISSYPYSCALRAGASYNYLLVNGERRLTPREMLRLQGFPDDFKVVVSDSQIRKQAGNAAPVHLIQRALERFLPLVFTKK